MARMMITLQENEREALRTMAQREMRDPRQQAAMIIRRELERAGLLPADPRPGPVKGREVRNVQR